MELLNKNIIEQLIETDKLIQSINDKMSSYTKKKNKKDKSLMLNVACILDEFSYNSFKNEANLIYITPNDWKEQIKGKDIDFLFVESVWTGLNDSWKFKFVNLQEKTPFKENSYKQIYEIIKYFKDKYIPTVFWNKEDPIHYDEFIYIAKSFDYIFTTDSNMVEKYKKDCKHNNVFTMQFAANLNIHNPIDKDINKIGDIAFAGSWYERHEERKRVTREILNLFKENDLTIYDRHFNDDTNGRNVFPEEYRKYIKGSLPYDEMVKAYKYYNIFLNVNTVLNSPTMYSRRVFELLACGTALVTTESQGIRKDFGELVLYADDKDIEKKFKRILNDKDYRDKLAVKNIRNIIKNHTYEKRFNSMIENMKINHFTFEERYVSVISPTNREEYIDNIINNFISQSYKNKELIIVINKNNIDINKVKSLVQQYRNIYVYKVDENKTLGECINFAISKSKNDYIAKFDDDDYYGKYYLEDMMNVFKFSDADVVGKKSIYIYYEENNSLEIKYPNTENRYIDFVSGATLIFTKDIYNRVGVESRNIGEDTSFIEKCRLVGGKLYSSDRFNYVAVRRSDKSTHTWQIEDSKLQSKSVKVEEEFNNYDEIKEFVSI